MQAGNAGQSGHHATSLSVQEIRTNLLDGSPQHPRRVLFLDLADWLLKDRSKVFKRFDANGSGSIEMSELKIAISMFLVQHADEQARHDALEQADYRVKQQIEASRAHREAVNPVSRRR